MSAVDIREGSDSTPAAALSWVMTHEQRGFWPLLFYYFHYFIHHLNFLLSLLAKRGRHTHTKEKGGKKKRKNTPTWSTSGNWFPNLKTKSSEIVAPNLLFVFSHYVKSPIIKSNGEKAQKPARIIWNLLANKILLEVLVEVYIELPKLLRSKKNAGAFWFQKSSPYRSGLA